MGILRRAWCLVYRTSEKVMTNEQKIEIREFLILKGFNRRGSSSATNNPARYTEHWSNGEDVVKLHWKIEHKIKHKK